MHGEVSAFVDSERLLLCIGPRAVDCCPVRWPSSHVHDLFIEISRIANRKATITLVTRSSYLRVCYMVVGLKRQMDSKSPHRTETPSIVIVSASTGQCVHSSFLDYTMLYCAR